MATAASASASPAALRAKTPAPGAHPSPKPSLAFPWPSPGASASASAAASGRLHASLHLGGVRGVGTANGAGLHVLHPDVKPLVVPKMAGGAGAQKSILLYHCEEMRDLAQQVAARNDDIELCTISWSDQSDEPNDHSSLLRVGLLALMIANLILTVANSCIPSRRRR